MPRQTTFLKAGTHEPKWVVVDAANVPLGRLAARIATVLQGKHAPDWTPHAMSGDYVIVINAGQVALTGRKSEQKMRKTYSGHPGGLKHIPYGWMQEHRPIKLVEEAVRRMLPKTRLGRVMLSNLKVYEGAEHPHQAQQPVAL